MLFSTTTHTKPTTTQEENHQNTTTHTTTTTTKIKITQKSKSHRERDRFVGFRRSWRLWVAGEVESSWVEGSGSKIGGSKALALGQRLWVRGVIWALGSPTKLKIGLWVRGAKSLGHRRSRSSWVAGNGLSLSLSLCAWAWSHSHSLSLCFSENDIWK